MIATKELFERYLSFINSCWEDIELFSEYDQSGSFKSDWLQANWELIVENQISEQCIVLEFYGEGADCNGASSRVLFPDQIPTHQLICKSSNGDTVHDVLNNQHLNTKEIDLVFDRFVCIKKDGWYYEAPPFDKILCHYQNEDVVVEFKDADLHLKAIS